MLYNILMYTSLHPPTFQRPTLQPAPLHCTAPLIVPRGDRPNVSKLSGGVQLQSLRPKEQGDVRMEPTPHTTETDTSEHHFPHLESSPPQTLIPVIGRSLVSPLKSLIFRHCGLILAILPPNSLASVTGD